MLGKKKKQTQTMFIQIISIGEQCLEAPLSCLALAGRKNKWKHSFKNTALFTGDHKWSKAGRCSRLLTGWLSQLIVSDIKCPTHWYTQPAKPQAASIEESKHYKGTKHPVLMRSIAMSLGTSFNMNCFLYPLWYYLSKQFCYLKIKVHSRIRDDNAKWLL